MKKFFALTLAVLMVLSMAACTPKEEADPTDGTTTAPTTEPTTVPTEPAAALPASALEILENIWNLFADEEKFFAVGGDAANMVDNAPGTSNVDDMAWKVYLTEDQKALVDDAAVLMNMMNSNMFTSAAIHLKDGADVAAFAAETEEILKNNMWMCGMPEERIIVDFGGGYLLIAFGHTEHFMEFFKAHLNEAYPEANVLYAANFDI